MPILRAGSQNQVTGKSSTPARSSLRFRQPLRALGLIAALLALVPARAEPQLPSLLFPGITDPFSVIPPDHVPKGSPPPLLTPNTPPNRVVPPLVPALVTVPTPRQDAANCVRRDSAGRFMGWMDYKHCVYSGRTLATARWFDDLFGDWHEDEATMQLRLITQITTEEAEGVSMRVTARASADLPNARQRMRLIISDENDPEELFNHDTTGQTRRNRQTREDNRSSAALRWVPFEAETLDTSMDVGVRGLDPPDLFVRARARKTWSLTDDSIARLVQTFRYGSESRERSVTQIDIERAMDENSVLRFGNTYDYFAPRNSEGFYWTHLVSMSHALKRTRSLSYGISVNGPTQPDWHVDTYGPWIAFRRPFLRPWLFLEIEPHYTWYRDLDWEGRASLVVRMEMQFGIKK
jgi:hypothetical protein